MNLKAERKAQKRFSHEFSLLDRLKLWLVSRLGYWIIRILGSTIRWKVVGWENYKAIESAHKNVIFTFWHGGIFMGTYFWRNRGIVVMTSRNKDGEYIAHVIRRFGYGTARGSSSRGGRDALVEMIHQLRQNNDVAFTVDGPKGPRYIAKPGAVWIASKTGDAVFPFHISAEKKWVLNSWDRFQIPRPFTRALVLMAPAIYVRREASEQELKESQQELQHVLEGLLERGDSYWLGKSPIH